MATVLVKAWAKPGAMDQVTPEALVVVNAWAEVTTQDQASIFKAAATVQAKASHFLVRQLLMVQIAVWVQLVEWAADIQVLQLAV